MPRRRNTRALTRIEAAAAERAREIAEFIVLEINRTAPYDEARHPSHRGTRRLRGSYRVVMDGDTAVIRTNRPYWIFVEKGTRRNDYRDAQPHVAPAIELARQLYGGLG